MENFKVLHGALTEQRDGLVTRNSVFPATREFLDKRNLSTVDELDREGVQELISHLRKKHLSLIK